MKRSLSMILLAVILIFTVSCGTAPATESSTEEVAAESESSEEEKEEASADEESAADDPADPADESEEDRLDPDTVTLDGEPATLETLFAGNTYTLVNIWASWCGPCISELPELEVINAEFGEKGCGVVGILYDGHEEEALKFGKEVIAYSGVTYPNVLPWIELAEMFEINAVPTSFFVDADGRIVGDLILGVQPDTYRRRLAELLE